MIEEFNLDSKAECDQLNLARETKTNEWPAKAGEYIKCGLSNDSQHFGKFLVGAWATCPHPLWQ